MNPWNLPDVLALLDEAGRIALHHYDSPRREQKADGTVVTQADRAIEDLLTRRLHRPAEGSHLLGEETIAQRDAGHLRQALAGHAYIVDPIDGTACYAHHLPIWGVSIGYAHQGVLSEGAVYLPVLGELFVSDGDQVLYGCGEPGRLPELQPLPALDPPALEHGLIAVTQGIAKRGGIHLPNVIHNLACAVVPLTYLMLGRYAAYLARIRLWDLAGSWPLLHKAGIRATGRDGTPLGLAIDDATYQLDLARPDALKLRQAYTFGSPGVTDYIGNRVDWPD